MQLSQNLDQRHDWAAGVLAWYVNDTLTPEERGSVDAHLRECLTCRRDEKFLRSLAQGIKTSDMTDLAPRAGFATLAARIDAVEQRARRRPLALAAAAAFVGLGAGMLALFWSGADTAGEAEYRTLTSTSPVSSTLTLSVVCETAISAETCEAVLRAGALEILDGPGEHGVYTVSASSVAAAQTAEQRLSDAPEIAFARRSSVVPTETRPKR